MSEVMSKRAFVDALFEVALDGAIRGEVQSLDDPPGRRPSLDLVTRSEWFKGLTDDDRSMVVGLMREAGYAVLHSVLCVLDGVAAIEAGPHKGSLRLLYERDGQAIELTSHAEPDLHDLLKDRG
jgi:hypothetical protein